jgi:ferredoxin
MMYEFITRTGKIFIDHDKCENCKSNICVDSCRTYGRDILKIDNKRAVLAIDLSESSRLCNECLACEEKCRLYGQDAIMIQLPIPNLVSFRKNLENRCL